MSEKPITSEQIACFLKNEITVKYALVSRKHRLIHNVRSKQTHKYAKASASNKTQKPCIHDPKNNVTRAILRGRII